MIEAGLQGEPLRGLSSISARFGLLALLVAQIANAETLDKVGFTLGVWDLERARVVEHLGRTALMGTAFLEGVDLENGVIEVDLAVRGDRSYPGVLFHVQSEQDYERMYLRPHRAGLYPDAIQYAPAFNGVTAWQLYHGEGYTAAVVIPENV